MSPRTMPPWKYRRRMFRLNRLTLGCLIVCSSAPWLMADSSQEINRAARSLLSNRCYACHGPDAGQRQAGFRLDDRQSYLSPADSGQPPVVPGEAAASPLWQRITSQDSDQRMPPPEHGAALSQTEQEIVAAWIGQGAPLAQHWSFVPPQRPAVPSHPQPQMVDESWNHPIDRFILAQQLARGLQPSPQATRPELLRRVSLDLVGLPPTPAEVAEFVKDTSAQAYQRQVDRLLASPAFGEHWARKWLDLARYADSAGYADDPPRTIWAYRDWVVKAINANLTIDEFTRLQLAGDLLAESGQDQLLATAFHRNTLTNNEGGTNDEEFRNVAIVDRVNTTMAVWMGVTISCAQCHSHKYDPFSQEEYFKLLAIFNQTQDADRSDESPILELYSDEQLQQISAWQARIAQIEQHIENAEGLDEQLQRWEATLRQPEWQTLKPIKYQSSRQNDAVFSDSGTIRVQPLAGFVREETQQVELQLSQTADPICAIAVQTLPDPALPQAGAGLGEGNFVLSGVKAEIVPAEGALPLVRFVRIQLPGEQRILSLAEVQVLVGEDNVALGGSASQSSTSYDGAAGRAIDGNTTGEYFAALSTTHTNTEDAPWWEVQLAQPAAVDKIVVWNRTDSGLQSRLQAAQVLCLDDQRQEVFRHALQEAPQQQVAIAVGYSVPITFTAAYAAYAPPGFPAAAVLDNDSKSGWSVPGQVDRQHLLALIPDRPLKIQRPSVLRLTLEHQSGYQDHILGSYAILASHSQAARDWAALGETIGQIHATPPEQRSGEQQQKLRSFFAQNFAEATRALRDERAKLHSDLSAIKPATSVPVMRELDSGVRRRTFVQLRGDYRALAGEVQPGTPAVFHPLPAAGESNQVTRLDLANWLMDRRNPLTARVWTNRMWESLFGLGLVRTSEEFGAQGDLPSHPELLDWLACELMALNWDFKAMLRMMVTSQTYCQTSMVSTELLERDRDNVWLARGPRVRLSAEMIRDSVLLSSGLLSQRMYGPPVQPPQPDMGLRAAFGSATDWSASTGEDRYRRGLYTKWRRSSPYPSMATFDAPSREVCVLRRDNTNTPLQALVTLNDPAFVEAAQALARRVVLEEVPHSQTQAGTQTLDAQRLMAAFEYCTARQPSDAELQVLLELLHEARQHLLSNDTQALALATDPLGPLPEQASPVELAAWTSVCNVLMNLDEVLMKR
ncbi:MAG: DUF1553 domain-containing protein [Pirellulaceae bacterium]|nr:DUF1553 domain-containing protein [Pirellulaceae bacterium]